MPSFRDHFSAGSHDYARFRPQYPDELFAALADAFPRGRAALAWDVGCGSGQAAVGLAARVARVIASDASVAQLARAIAHPRVHYCAAAAEASPLRDRSVDLVTIAQALHWFDLERFWPEVERVARPGAVCAVWSYGRSEIGADVDPIAAEFHDAIVGPYWPGERAHVEEGYARLPFPFPLLPAPALAIAASLTLDAYCGYVSTWSATLRYREVEGRDPIPALRTALSAVWGARPRTVRWPIRLRMGRIST